jgi:hypothetical protein
MTLLSVANLHAKEPIGIDASSNAAAKASFGRMVESLTARKWQVISGFPTRTGSCLRWENAIQP